MTEKLYEQWWENNLGGGNLLLPSRSILNIELGENDG